MKKIILLILLMLPLLSNAQGKQSIVKLKNGTVLKGNIKTIDPMDAVTIEIAGVETKIKMDAISSIEEAGETVREVTRKDSKREKQVELQMVEVEDPLKDYKGFLLAEGNNVYVCCGNSDKDKWSDYDREAAKVITTLLKRDGFWNVVDNMNEAHFTINYFVDTRWSDKAYCSLSTWRTGKDILLSVNKSNESASDNSVIAKKCYEKHIRPLQKKIQAGKLSKRIIEDFTVK